jgi:hypothetical protein
MLKYRLFKTYKSSKLLMLSKLSVGIKGGHVWSHDQGDRLNHVTNLSSGETR